MRRLALHLISFALLPLQAPLAAQQGLLHAGDPLVNSARVATRRDTFALRIGSHTVMLMIATTVDSAQVLRVERITIPTGTELSVDSFAARRPGLAPVFDVSRDPAGVRKLRFSAGRVSGTQVGRNGTRPVEATLDPPAFYANSTDLLLQSLPLEEGREFAVAMWDAESGPYTLRLQPAVRDTVRTMEGGSCAAWRVDVQERSGPAQYWVEEGSRSLLAYESGGLHILILRHSACSVSDGAPRSSR